MPTEYELIRYSPENALCLICDWDGGYMLPNGGAIHSFENHGNAHCPQCGAGKLVNQDVIDPLMAAVNRFLKGGD